MRFGTQSNFRRFRIALISALLPTFGFAFAQPSQPEEEEAISPSTGTDLPNTVRAAMELGNEAFAKKDYRQAREFYAEARRVLPDHVLLLVNAGLTEFYLGEHEEAETLLRRALREEPGLPQAWQILGLIHLDAGRFEQAMAAFAQVVVLDPRNARGHNYLGVAIGQMGWFDGAESEFRRAVELDPRYADAHFNLAFFALQRRHPATELARRHYHEAVKLGAERDPEIEKKLTSPPAP
jgi:tetratricopeptide (TPR) repeat protein